MRCSECNCELSTVRARRHARTCSPPCKTARDTRLGREARLNVAAGAGPGLPSTGSPAATVRSTAPSIPTGRLSEPDTNPPPDPLTTAHASSLAIFHALPYVESITIHRDGHLYALRVGPPGESVVDVLTDLGRMEGAGKARKPAREMEIG